MEGKLAFIINTARYERVAFALGVAAAAAATGCDVRILFGHGGVARLKKGATDDLDEKSNDFITKRVKLGLEKGRLRPISELLETLKKLGGRVYACPEAMELHNLMLGDLVKEVDEVRSVVRFVTEDLEHASIVYV